MRITQIVAVSGGILTAILFYNATVQKGVQKERARVETQGTKVDAKAKKARAAVATRPAPSVLDGQWRD